MRNDYTHITVVLDRSGSMASCKTDTEGGLQQLIQDQKKQPGRCTFTLVQFDDKYEFVHKGVDIQQVPDFHELVPRAMTALYDAVGRAIVETGEYLAAMKEEDRPALVFFQVLTDGDDNQSREYVASKIKEMIEHQKSVYNWVFTFLGADLTNATSSAANIGIGANNALQYSKSNTRGVYAMSSAKLSTARGLASTGVTGQSLSASLDWNDEDREEANK